MNNLSIEKSDNATIFNYHFANFIDLINYLDKTLDNRNIFKNNVSHDDKDLEWFNNKTFVAAKNLVLNGSKIIDISDIVEVNKTLEDNLPFISKIRNVQSSYYGFRPNVSKFLNGNPKSMYKLIRSQKYNKINIIFNAAFCGYAENTQILNRGICTLNLIRLLSNFGYDIDFKFFGMSCDDSSFTNAIKEYIKFDVMINTFDLATLYYPLCDTSFYRRIIFNLIEKTPVKSKKWMQYGEPIVDKNNLESLCNIDAQIIITSPDILNIKGNDIIEDFINFYKNLNIEKYLDGNKLEYNNDIKKFILRK